MNFRTDFAWICAWIFRLNFSCAGWTHEFVAWIFRVPPRFCAPITFSRLRAFCSCAGWAHGFFFRIFSMRKIHASKLFRKRGSKQKIHAPQNEKSMQNPCGNSCAKFVRQSWSEPGAQNTKSMHPQNEKIMQEFVRLFSFPQAWKRHCPCHTTMQSKSMCE